MQLPAHLVPSSGAIQEEIKFVIINLRVIEGNRVQLSIQIIRIYSIMKYDNTHRLEKV